MNPPNPDDIDLFGIGSDIPLNLSLLDINSINPDHQLPPSAPEHTGDQGRRLRLRNRNPRSCDFCRSRKTACIIEATLPCAACRSRGLQCTFAQPRRRRQMQGEGAGMSSLHNVVGGETRYQIIIRCNISHVLFQIHHFDQPIGQQPQVPRTSNP